jgi:DNA-binding NarL/FixJ family response regulator
MVPIPRSSPSSKLRVLIADDMPQVRQDLRVLLLLMGEFDVVGEAADGADTIAQAEAFQPDVVVLDLEMPGVNGLQAAASLRQRGLVSHIVLLSVHAEPEEVRRGEAVGVDVFVSKGAPFDELMRALRPPP